MSNGTDGYVILVRFRAKAGQERAFAQEMRSAVPATRAEPGNRQYEFYGDQDDPLNFMLYEEFANEAALQTHRARPEMAAHLAAIKPMLDAAPDATFWSQALTNAKPAGGKTGEAGHVTLVRFRMKPDTVDAVLDAIGGDLDDMQGNIRFDLNRGRADPLDCMICARWVSRAVWEAHNAQPKFKDFAAHVTPLLDIPMRRALFKPIS
ncbi:MAG: antibiotic biosynthesis monooxygenase [Xanthobacteraceae bacterium]